MKPHKFLITVAAAVCTFAFSAHAQTTNVVTFKATMTSQGTINTSFQGTNTSFALEKPAALTTAGLITEIGDAKGVTFTKAAKLVIIDSSFAVLDGTNLVDASGIMSLSLPSTNNVQSGVRNGTTFLAFKSLTQLTVIEVDFNDVGVGNGSDLQFSMRGLASGTTTDTVPSTNGVYTETFNAKITDMTGSGTKGTNSTPFVVTGSISASGKGNLSL